MTSEELLIKSFDFKEKYEKNEWYFFEKDSNFMDYLKKNLPSVYDFIYQSVINYREDVIVAGITIEENKPKIYLNPHRITFMHKGVSEYKWDLSLFYETLGCILWHESLHVILRHFAHSDLNARWNVVQDIFIDNLIHSKYQGWRNWSDYIEKLNDKIEKEDKKDILKFLSVDKNLEGKVYIGDLNDSFLYSYLDILSEDAEEQNKRRFDSHFEENLPKEGSNEKFEDFDPGLNKRDESQGNGKRRKKEEDFEKSDIFDRLASKARERNEKARSNIFSEKNISDIITEKSFEGSKYDLLNIIKKYLKKISYKQKRYTWKKTSRKLYGIRPGILYKKQPGEVLIIIDTSQSMLFFLRKYFASFLKDLYFNFVRLSKIYGAFSFISYLEADDKITDSKELKNVSDMTELIEKTLKGGGGTDYKPVFDWIEEKRKKEGERSFPDLIIFLSDFGTNLDFLKEEKYAFLDNRLLWIYVGIGNYVAKSPPRGDLFFLNNRYYGVDLIANREEK